MTYLRSLLLAIALVIVTPPYAAVSIATWPLSAFTRYRIISSWSKLAVWLAKVLCGVRWRVIGREHLPERPSIILSKHQSAWETLAFQAIFPPHSWVLKRSLLYVPFFGWGLAMLSPIAIDRRHRVKALRQTLEQGRERLARGFWIVIFPEGERVAPGQRGHYQVGGAWLATHSRAPVVPVALNSGELWARNAFLKHPGTITVVIGEPIDPAGMEPEELNRRVEEWIETQMAAIDGTARSRSARRP